MRKLAVPQLVKKFFILWNPRITSIYRVHTIPPPVHITNNNNGVNTFPLYFFKIGFNNIPYPCPYLPSGLLPSDIPTKILYVFVSSPCGQLVAPIAF